VIGPQHMYATQKETWLPCFIAQEVGCYQNKENDESYRSLQIFARWRVVTRYIYGTWYPDWNTFYHH
jgi:hypothetical protein